MAAKSSNDNPRASYELAVIYSTSSPAELRSFLDSYEPDAVASMRIDYKRSPKNDGEYVETNRTIVLVKTSVFEALCREGYDQHTSYDFRIAPYEIRQGNLPPEGCTYALFVVIPSEIKRKEAEGQLHDRLGALVEAGLLPPNSYNVSFPAISREEGTYRGYALVSFTDAVPNPDRARVKVLLDMTRWYNEPSFCHVAWCRSSALKRPGGRSKRP